MTAIAIALVLCCAMVCGTVLALKGVGTRDAPDSLARREITALQTAGAKQAADISVLRAEVDSLRSHVALRGAL